MEPYFKPKMLRSISFYISRSFKFYDIKVDHVAPMFFVAVLAINFISYYLFGPDTFDIDVTKPESIERFKLVSSRAVMVSFVTNIVINLITAGYMYAYIYDLKEKNYSLKECLIVTLKNSYKIIAVYLLVSIYIPAYVISLRLPGVWVFTAMGILLVVAVLFFVLYFMLIFSTCFIQDKNKDLIGSLKSSAKLSKGHKIEIFSIILIVKFISLMLMFFALSFVSSPGNELVQIFVESFLSTILSLVEVRIISLIYFDLEY